MEHLYEDINGFDLNSFQLGMVEAFCEIVMQGVKNLALSPVFEQDQWEILKPAVEKIALRFQVQSYVENDLLSSDLAPDSAVKGKIVVLFYKEQEVLVQYQALKKEAALLQQNKQFDENACKKISIQFRRLLSYSEEAIQNHYTAK